MSIIITELERAEAIALAQFVKRLTWRDIRVCAVDDDETYEMKSAIGKLQNALGQEGFSPR